MEMPQSTTPTNHPAVATSPNVGQRLYGWGKRLFSGRKIDDTRAKTPEVALAEARPAFQSEMRVHIETSEVHRIDMKVRGIFERAEALFWMTGFRDGERGLAKRKAHEIARHRASNLRDEITSEHQGEVRRLETEVSALKQIHETREKDYKRHEQYYERVMLAYQKRPRIFSRALGLVYLGFAFVLLLADIPLALRLIREGFRFDEVEPLTGLFNDPWLVFTANWELFLLSFGIAFCTIYIKIFYDEFIARPKEHHITQFKGMHGVDQGKETETVKRFVKGRSWFKTGVLAFLLVTIVVLGIFRYESDRALRRGTTTTTLAYEVAEQQAGDAVEEEDLGLVALVTFILITLLFPIVGGISASLGLNYVENRRELNVSRKLRAQAEKAFDEATRKLKDATQELNKWEGRLGWCMKKKYVKNLTRLFLSHYEHGYEHGWLKPVKQHRLGDNLFTIAESVRDKLLARGILDMHWNQKSLAGRVEADDLFNRDSPTSNAL